MIGLDLAALAAVLGVVDTVVFGLGDLVGEKVAVGAAAAVWSGRLRGVQPGFSDVGGAGTA